ncbi:hypothetical protein [Yinghuangia sp. YIM S09857]|uniref:hypothetical protein n=1 Tax=Yinghuangia sp. YIM S09857 TaxID=3436929 RepID=UPI003F538382
MNPSSTFLALAPAPVIDAVLSRADPPLLDALLGGPAPPAPDVVTRAAGHEAVRVRLAAARNPTVPPDLLVRLVGARPASAKEADDPAEREVATAVLEHPRATRSVLLAVARFADQAGVAVDAYVSPASAVELRHLYALAESADPLAVAYALSGLRMTVARSPTVLVAACLRLWRDHGRPTARAAFEGLSPDAWTGVDSASVDLRTALAVCLADDHALGALRALSAELSGTRNVASALRAIDEYSGGAAEAARVILLAPHEPLDWDLLTDEHAARRWSVNVRIVLADQPGCPAELAIGAARSPAVGRGRAHLRRVRAAALKALATQGAGSTHAAVLRAREFGLLADNGGLPAAPHAYDALRLGMHLPTGEDEPAVNAGLEGEQLRELTARHLGSDADAWLVALRLLPEFAGTLAELPRTAEAATV